VTARHKADITTVVIYVRCPACLVTKFMPKVRQQHPGLSDEKALLRAIEVMEAELRSGLHRMLRSCCTETP
jgi:hypothetical protein